MTTEENKTSRNRKRKRQRNPKPSKEEPIETTPKNQNEKKNQRDTKNQQHGGSSAPSKRPKPSNFLDAVRSLSLSFYRVHLIEVYGDFDLFIRKIAA